MLRRVLGHIRRWPVPFVALLFALGGGAMAAPALADTTIGQTGGTMPTVNACLVGPVTLADTNYVVPSGGWITTFSFESIALPGPHPPESLDFRVLRPAQGSYTVVGVTDVDVFDVGGVSEFSTAVDGVFVRAIPVQAGDILGLYVPSSLLVCARVASGGGVISGTAPSPPNVGETVLTDGVAIPTLDLNLSANLITVPTRQECKHPGWELLGFKNPGACLAFSRNH
jgi:hypothetical protein